ncbi:hypothetical protein SCP_0310340 [Sparassis crispa]|uniref:Uncharacterized protein n=1 Tax=Sparassis crispa TaxID=139825 RepID=A0A401GGJ5_9APHY|nr:hypothetical protein SCP_0310340 [Sparassis crispa]GBE81307.1 hypothetical protein SCP_0310340 [Sparassis crispa]
MSEFAGLQMKNYAVFIMELVAAMKVPCTRDRGWAEGLRDHIERARAMHAHLTVEGFKVPLTLKSHTEIEDALAAYKSLMASLPASSISKKEGKKVIRPRPVALPAPKIATSGTHSMKSTKPTITSPIPRPALTGSASQLMHLSLNCEMGSAGSIDRGSVALSALTIGMTPVAPSAQSRHPSPLLIGSIAGEERPVKCRTTSPPTDPMMIDNPAPICTASAMPPPQLQMSAPSRSQSIAADTMDDTYSRPALHVTATLPRHPSDRSISRQTSARSLHIAPSPIEHTRSQGSHSNPSIPAISLDDPLHHATFHSYFADVLPANFRSLQLSEQITTLESALRCNWQRTRALEDSQHTMCSQLDAIMGALGGDPALFATRFGVLATRIDMVPAHHREVTQGLLELEKHVRDLEGSDDEFPSEEEDEVVHSISMGTEGDEQIDFDGED